MSSFWKSRKDFGFKSKAPSTCRVRRVHNYLKYLFEKLGSVLNEVLYVKTRFAVLTAM